jgi:hypothetical protein
MYRLGTLFISTLLTFTGVGATPLLSGGWQSAAAFLAMSAGILCLLTYISLIAGAERPRRVAPTPRDLHERVAPEPTTTVVRRPNIRRMPTVQTHG